MQTNKSNFETPPPCSDRVPATSPPKKSIATNLEETASTVMAFFGEGFAKVGALFHSSKEETTKVETLSVTARVYDPDYLFAKKCSWAICGYQKVFKKGTVTGSPGPGNGYFETMQLLLDQIDLISDKLELKKSFDRTPFQPFLERMFPDIPRLTRCNYPAILYFIARRIMDQKLSSVEMKRQLDFWMVTVEPSKSLYTSAMFLIAHCHHLFHLLRYGWEEDFVLHFHDFEKSWKHFFKTLKQEPEERSYLWCPDICIHVIMRDLAKYSKYSLKIEEAKRVSSYFQENSEDVLESIEKYPDRLCDTYENNRAYVIALKIIELSAFTFDSFAGVAIREVRILDIERHN